MGDGGRIEIVGYLPNGMYLLLAFFEAKVTKI